MESPVSVDLLEGVESCSGWIRVVVDEARNDRGASSGVDLGTGGDEVLHVVRGFQPL